MHNGVLDAMIHGSEKAESAGLDAMGLYFLAQSYACAYLTDGAVARRAAERIAGRRTAALAARLVTAGLWLVDGDGWRFADWAGQPTRASVEAAEAALLAAEEAERAAIEADAARLRARREAAAARTARYRERVSQRESVTLYVTSPEASRDAIGSVTESVTDTSQAASPERHGGVTSRDPDLRISGSGSPALDLFQPDLKTSSPETAGARSTGRAKPKRAKSEPSDSERAYAEAFAAGVIDAVGGNFSPPVDSHSRYLFRSVWAHAKGSDGATLTGVALLAWIRETAAEYRRAKPNDARFGGFTIKNWLTWLNAGRPRDDAPRGVPPVQRAPGYQAEEERKRAEFRAGADARRAAYEAECLARGEEPPPF